MSSVITLKSISSTASKTFSFSVSNLTPWSPEITESKEKKFFSQHGQKLITWSVTQPFVEWIWSLIKSQEKISNKSKQNNTKSQSKKSKSLMPETIPKLFYSFWTTDSEMLCLKQDIQKLEEQANILTSSTKKKLTTWTCTVDLRQTLCF